MPRVGRSGADDEGKVEELSELEKIKATTVSERFSCFLLPCNFIGGYQIIIHPDTLSIWYIFAEAYSLSQACLITPL